MKKIFKAKRIDNGKWIEFDFNQCSGADTSNGYRVNLTDNLYYSNTVRVDPKTICQYTGINDSEGNRIFEGDEVNDCSFVRMQNGCWIVCWGGCHNYLYASAEDLELSGHNIHDRG